MRAMTKPRIVKMTVPSVERCYYWWCHGPIGGRNAAGFGSTPKEAYSRWATCGGFVRVSEEDGARAVAIVQKNWRDYLPWR